MFIIYDFIALLAAVIYLPVYLFKRKFHRGFWERLGFLPRNLELGRPVWIHAVSVGEAIAVRGLLEELRKAYPSKRFVISTVTSTGNKIAKGLAKENDFVTYLPLDFSFIVRSVLDKINPEVFIIAETELWPNLISRLSRKKIPIIVVNARISDGSFRGYQSVKFLIKPALSKINLFCAQTGLDAKRLIFLGVREKNVNITGNMKFDAADYSQKTSGNGTGQFRAILSLGKEEKLLVAGSTHPGEEAVILKAYKELLVDFSFLRLLIAPRHSERAAEVCNLTKKFNFEPIRTSQLDPQIHQPANSQTVFILDTVGELVSYYAIADIVFVGKSLIKKGGQNILEPASLGKPVLFGPYMFNFRDIADLFISNNAAVLVSNQREMVDKIRQLLNNPPLAAELSRRAKEVFLTNQGATRKNTGLIKNFINSKTK